LGKVTGEVLQRLFMHGVVALSEIGVLGDSRAATVERGVRYFTVLQDRLEQIVREKLEY
jgi:creatinine amidohydrolase/Fe(II)-dependent formamide hydrolase-like protein